MVIRFIVATVFLLHTSVLSAVEVTRISPASGFPYGGTLVHLFGDFGDQFIDCRGCGDCPIAVYFGDTPATVLFSSGGILLVIAPPHAIQTVDVAVRMPQQPEIRLAQAFRYEESGDLSPGSDWELFIIPTTAHEIPGANGSIWTSEFTIYNPTEYRVPIAGPLCPGGGACSVTSLEPRTSRSIRVYGPDGSAIWLPSGIAPRIALQLRIRDLTRDADGWGVEVPIIDRRAFRLVHHLVDVPNDSRFRVMLRAYQAPRIVVRVLPLSGTEVIEETAFESPVFGSIEPFAIDPMTTVVRNSGHSRLRVEVEFGVYREAQPPGGWAFLSITNNTTSQVTLITPKL